MLVTPTGKLRRPQPDPAASSALAGSAATVAAISAAMLSHIPGRVPSLTRYIVVVPFTRVPSTGGPPRAIARANQTRKPAAPLLRPQSQGGRLVDAADQALKPH